MDFVPSSLSNVFIKGVEQAARLLRAQNTHKKKTTMNCAWQPNDGVGVMLEVLGSILVLLLWTAPVKDIWTGRESVFATKSTKLLASGFTYPASLSNCALWVAYGLDKFDVLLVPNLVNATGFLLNLSFVLVFYRYSEGEQRRTFLIQLVVLVFLVVVGFFILVGAGSEPVGYLAAFLNTLMLFAPLAAAGQVIRTRSTRGMPFLPLVFVFCTRAPLRAFCPRCELTRARTACSLAWFLFGLNLCNLPIMIPNALGIVFGAAQLSLYAWARRQEPNNPDVEAGLRYDESVLEMQDDFDVPEGARISSTMAPAVLSSTTAGRGASSSYVRVAQAPADVDH